jgi:hypothetical protein
MFVHGILALNKTLLLCMFVGKVGRGRVKPLKHYKEGNLLVSEEMQPTDLTQQTQINTTPSRQQTCWYASLERSSSGIFHFHSIVQDVYS